MIKMIKIVLGIYGALFVGLLLYICLVLLAFPVMWICLLPIILMLEYTNWSAITMAFAYATQCALLYAVYILYAKSAFDNARSYLKEQINKRKPNPETHCPTCGYDLKGLSRIRCPECGKFNPQKFLDQNQTRKRQNKKRKQRTMR